MFSLMLMAYVLEAASLQYNATPQPSLADTQVINAPRRSREAKLGRSVTKGIHSPGPGPWGKDEHATGSWPIDGSRTTFLRNLRRPPAHLRVFITRCRLILDDGGALARESMGRGP